MLRKKNNDRDSVDLTAIIDLPVEPACLVSSVISAFISGSMTTYPTGASKSD